jgi:cell division protease FtsH
MVQLAPPANPFLANVDGVAGARPYSEATAAAVDAEVQGIISASHEDALRLLRAHRNQLDALAQALLARETLDEQEILSVTGLPAAPSLETHKAAAEFGT